MIKILMILILSVGLANAGDVRLTWDQNSESDLLGYKLHYGEMNVIPFTEEIDVGNVIEYKLTGLVDGVTYYIAVTAYNTSFLESEYSDILEYVARPKQVIIRIIDRPQSLRMIFE